MIKASKAANKRLKQIRGDLKYFRQQRKNACCSFMTDDCDENIYFLIKERKELRKLE